MTYLLSNNFEQVVGSLTADEASDILEAVSSTGTITPAMSGLRFAGLTGWIGRTRQVADSYTAWEAHRAAWAADPDAWLANGVSSASRRAALIRGECLYTPNQASRDANMRAFLWVPPTNNKSGWRTGHQMFWSGNGNPAMTRPGTGQSTVNHSDPTTFAQLCAAAINADHPVGYRCMRINQWPLLPKVTLSPGGEVIVYLRDGQKVGSWPNLYQDDWVEDVLAIWEPFLETFEAAGGKIDYLLLDAEYRDTRYYQQNDAYYYRTLTPGAVAADRTYTVTLGAESVSVTATDSNATTLCNRIALEFSQLSVGTHPQLSAMTAVHVPGSNPPRLTLTHDSMALGYGIPTALTTSATGGGTFTSAVVTGSSGRFFPHPNYPQDTTWYEAIREDARLTDEFIASELLPIRAEMDDIENWAVHEGRTYRFDAQRQAHLRKNIATAIFDPLLEVFPNADVHDYEDTLTCGNVLPSSAGSHFGAPLGCGYSGGTHQARNFYSGSNFSNNTKSQTYIPGTGLVDITRTSEVRGLVETPANGDVFSMVLDGYTVSHTVTSGQTAAQVATALVNAWNAVTSGQSLYAARYDASIVSGATLKIIPTGSSSGWKHEIETVVFSVTRSGISGGTFTKSVVGYGWFPRLIDDWWRLHGMISASAKPIVPWLLPRTDPAFNYDSNAQIRIRHLLCMLASAGYVAYWNGNQQYNAGNNPTPGAGDDLFDEVLTEAATWCRGGIAVPLPMPDRRAYDVSTPLIQDYLLAEGVILRLTITADGTYRCNYQPKLEPIGNKSVEALSELTFTAAGSSYDETVTALTYTLSDDAPAGATIHPTTGVFTWTPTAEQDDQTHRFTVWVTDDGPDELVNGETIEVEVTSAPNEPPTIEAIEAQSASEHTLFTLQVEADDDLYDLRYSLSGQPSGMSINSSTGLISWTPNETHGGSEYTATVIVTESYAQQPGDPPFLAAQAQFTITVSETNTAPVLATIPDQQGTEGELLTFTATATDLDVPAQTLTYSLSGSPPAGASIHASTGVFTWTPGESQAGEHTITVVVTDNGAGSLTDSQAVDFVIAESNRPPVVTAIPDQTLAAGELLSVQVAATDPDDDTLSYAFADPGIVPAGLAIDAETGLITWTPSSDQADATYEVTVRVSDDGDPSQSATTPLRITVDPPPLLPPVLIQHNTFTAYAGQLFEAVISASGGSELGDLTYSLLSTPLGDMAIDALTGEFSWTPQRRQEGQCFPVVVQVEDSSDPPQTDAVLFYIAVVRAVTVQPQGPAFSRALFTGGASVTQLRRPRRW